MNHVHACVSRLVFWSAKPEVQARYPRSCRALRLLKDAWKAETPHTYNLRRRRRLRFRSLASAKDGRRRRRLPTADGGPAHERPTADLAPFEEAEAVHMRELGRRRQVLARMKKQLNQLKAQVENFKTTKTL